jgi:hypothetical protein
MATPRPLVTAFHLLLVSKLRVHDTPRSLTAFFAVTVSPLTVYGVALVRSAFLLKCITVVFSPSKVAPFASLNPSLPQ